MKERQVNAMLIIKNCNLINMAGIYKEKKDLVVKDGKVLDICDDACQKYGQSNVIIDACGNYVTPGIVEPHCSLGVKEEVFRFEGNDADEANWFWFEGNFADYETNKVTRLGAEAARPHASKHRRLKRG